MPVTRSQTAKLASEERQETPNIDPNVVANVDANVVAVNNNLAKEVEDLRVKMSNVVADMAELREKVDSIVADQGAIKEVLIAQTALLKAIIQRPAEAVVQRLAPETSYPLKSLAEMRHLESTITPDNRRSYVTEMSRILSQAHLRRSIRNV